MFYSRLNFFRISATFSSVLLRALNASRSAWSLMRSSAISSSIPLPKAKAYYYLILVLIFLFTNVRIAVSVEQPPAEKELGIPLYSEMQFVEQTILKDGISVITYCSTASIDNILDFYRKTLNDAPIVMQGSSEGMKYKVLLDVNSPSKWKDSKKFIEISGNKQNLCSTIVNINMRLKDDSQIVWKTDDVPLGTESANIQPEKSSGDISTYKKGGSAKRKFIGIGGYVNTLNLSVGPTIIFYPFENLGLQGIYGIGTFKTYGVRGFYRFNPNSKFKPYIGIGYLHVEKEKTIIGVNTKIKDDSLNIFGGVELPIYKDLFAYVEVAGAPMKLEADITNGGRRARATVEYTPITIGTGIVYYLY